MRLFVLPLLFVVSCTSYIPFTDRAADRYRVTARDRPLLQYFVSDEFCLRRDTTDESANITPGGAIRYFRGRRIEELRVRRHTPGAVIDAAGDGLAVSFVPGDDRSAIVFAPSSERGWEYPADEDRSSRFAAPPPGYGSGAAGNSGTAGIGGERYVLQEDASHSIRYDGKLWTVHYERQPHLLIRSRDVEDRETRIKTLPGRKVGK